jgi:hypothetical protein
VFPKGSKDNESVSFPMPERIVSELLCEISTLAELKVTLFVARVTSQHPAGFSCISINEFVNGIKDKDGNIISKGVGLARQHVIRGIRLAEKRGTILTYTTGSKWKQTRWYFWNTEENRKLVQALKEKQISIDELVKSQESLF